MSTKQKKKIIRPDDSEPTPEQRKRASEVLTRLMSSIQKVDTKAPASEANEASMDNNNGGRIIYVLRDEDLLVVEGRYIIIVDNKKKSLELSKANMKRKTLAEHPLRKNLRKRRDSRKR